MLQLKDMKTRLNLSMPECGDPRSSDKRNKVQTHKCSSKHPSTYQGILSAEFNLIYILRVRHETGDWLDSLTRYSAWGTLTPNYFGLDIFSIFPPEALTRFSCQFLYTWLTAKHVTQVFFRHCLDLTLFYFYFFKICSYLSGDSQTEILLRVSPGQEKQQMVTHR